MLFCAEVSISLAHQNLDLSGVKSPVSARQVRLREIEMHCGAPPPVARNAKGRNSSSNNNNDNNNNNNSSNNRNNHNLLLLLGAAQELEQCQ